MLCSVVMPLLNEEMNVYRAYDRVRNVLDSCGCDWELICVDDGSTDRTFDLLNDLARKDPRVRGLRFSRNFGAHAALSSGFAVARGEVAFAVGADVQEPLDKLSVFIDRYREGYNVVWGVRVKRKDPALTRFLSGAFNEIFARFGMLESLPKNASFVLIDRKVLDALKLFAERNRMIWGLIAWAGFRQTFVPCAFGEREIGKSRWTLSKKTKLAIDTLLSFSFVPIRLVSGIGIVISMLSFLFGVWIGIQALLHGVAVQGWPTMMFTILFLAGLQLLVTGVMGEYIWRTLDETRQRPLYIISETVGFSEGDARLDHRELLHDVQLGLDIKGQ